MLPGRKEAADRPRTRPGVGGGSTESGPHFREPLSSRWITKSPQRRRGLLPGDSKWQQSLWLQDLVSQSQSFNRSSPMRVALKVDEWGMDTDSDGEPALWVSLPGFDSQSCH